MYGRIGRQKMLAELLSQHNIYGKQVTMNPNHIGTNFEDFLKEEEIIMNDRFKFRIWNGTEMHYNDFVVTATGFVGKITEEFLGKCVFNQEDLTLDKECILMQSTGLKDKNGKLIYEGDIIVIPNQYPFYDYKNNKDMKQNLYATQGKIIGESVLNYIGVVESIYNCWQYVYRCVNSNKRGISEGVNNILNDYGFSKDENSYFEVIGNIYENEELLNDR